ncbi:MAG: beta-N-acetylhexosaminidase, partial [Bacteroidetes bacterium]|nr:beta-N-acetylhexosaminidase [Bacteroidota bacterium]
MFLALLTFCFSPSVSLGDPGFASPKSRINVIPKPVSLTVGKGAFILTPATRVVSLGSNETHAKVAEYLVERLRNAAGYKLKLQGAANIPKANFILLNYIKDEELGKEGYAVEVKRDRVYLEANNDRGFFYAVQTLLQLMPPVVFSAKPARQVKWNIPCVSVRDYPRFEWRGMHLDVSRHFLPKDFIKTYIDMLAMHKMNVFHWHLTDDQGWRLEIRKYPKLTEVAAWRVDRENQPWNDRDPQREGEIATYGGFYTQDEIRGIVEYAAERNVTIVPEIEMPAHTTAVLAAYPQLSCTGGPFRVPPGGVWPITDIFCAGNDSTFLFLQDVLTEVMDLFPGKYIHIGGDEADKKEWKACPKCQARIRHEGLQDEAELQSYFVKRIERFIVSKGRRLIGWDEILEGGLPPEATVMSWRGIEGGVAAARQGHDAVMTPGSHCYFDHYQGREEFEPIAIGGYSPLSKVYSYEPVPDELNREEGKHILGAQGNVWTEYIPTPEHAQYMTLPRMAALAEVVWSTKESRNWDDFAVRVEHQMKRYQAAGYSYARSSYLVSISATGDSVRKRVDLSMATELNFPEIRYTLNGKDLIASSRLYVKPFPVLKTTTVKAGAFRSGKLLGRVNEQKICIHKALFKPVTLKYLNEGGGEQVLTNGLRGSTSFNGGGWQGFRQSDFEAIIDLGGSTQIKSLTASFLENTRSLIFFPTSVEYLISDDGVEFVSVGKLDIPASAKHQEPGIKEVPQKLKNVRARFVQVKAT